jgi:hypothetical protein
MSLGVDDSLLSTIADSMEHAMPSKYHMQRYEDTASESVRRTMGVQHALATRSQPAAMLHGYSNNCPEHARTLATDHL